MPPTSHRPHGPLTLLLLGAHLTLAAAGCEGPEIPPAPCVGESCPNAGMDLKVFFDDEALDPAARQRLADSEYIGTLYLRVFNRWPPYSLALATSLAEFYPTIGPLSLRGGQTLTFPRRLNVGTHWIAAVWWPQSRPKGFVPLRSGDLINTGTCEPPPYLAGGPAEEALHDEYYRCALPYGKRGVPRVVVKESDVGTTLKNVVVRINAEYDPRFEEATPTPSSSSDQ